MSAGIPITQVGVGPGLLSYRPALDVCAWHSPNTVFDQIEVLVVKRGSVVCDECWLDRLSRFDGDPTKVVPE